MRRLVLACVLVTWTGVCAAVFWNPRLISWDSSGLTFLAAFLVLVVGPWLLVLVISATDEILTFRKRRRSQQRGFPLDSREDLDADP